MFLLRVYRRERNLSRHETLRILKSEDGHQLRRWLGFEEEFPSESGFRYFEGQISPELQLEIDALLFDLLYQAGFLPTRPDQEEKVSLSFDGMLHEARSRMRCAQVSESCYQPAPRPCPAQEKDKREGAIAPSPIVPRFAITALLSTPKPASSSTPATTNTLKTIPIRQSRRRTRSPHGVERSMATTAMPVRCWTMS
jgi:hypothetical protein